MSPQEWMCVECNYYRPVQVYFRGILLPLFFEAFIGTSPVDVLKVQSSTLIQGALVFVWLVCRCTFVPQNIKRDCQFYYDQSRIMPQWFQRKHANASHVRKSYSCWSRVHLAVWPKWTKAICANIFHYGALSMITSSPRIINSRANLTTSSVLSLGTRLVPRLCSPL